MDLFSQVEALSVEELTWQIKRVVEADPILCDIAVIGEVSNFKAHTSGHLYFTLKDAGGQIRSACWKSSAQKLSFRPSNGDRVVATGHVEFYGARGEISFIVDTMRFAGAGAAAQAFERLKAELAADGLFDPARKKPLPVLPRCIGLITSPTGAAAHDVLSILRRRWPLARLVFIPAKVQGIDAPADLVRALTWASALDDLDVLIIGRGGGSAEDLWAFNDEEVARVAAEFPVPLVSAVGHETDFTILDFVADVRAATPSAAAELCAPDVRGVRAAIASYRARLVGAAEGDVEAARARLSNTLSRRVWTHPAERLSLLRERVATARRRGESAAAARVKIERRLLQARKSQLSALDPKRVLARGYVLVETSDGALVGSKEQSNAQQKVQIIWHDGRAAATIEN
ncbi:MAG TPA: exodeoxyribonuclease VII large subunit [Abditibacteriaceae bacterium]|jgi:exodeoxyribonuclease VII large subunit